eukprot:750517-Hanusia_phi.AAC.1
MSRVGLPHDNGRGPKNPDCCGSQPAAPSNTSQGPDFMQQMMLMQAMVGFFLHTLLTSFFQMMNNQQAQNAAMMAAATKSEPVINNANLGNNNASSGGGGGGGGGGGEPQLSSCNRQPGKSIVASRAGCAVCCLVSHVSTCVRSMINHCNSVQYMLPHTHVTQ